jgi:hypothetical protein
LIDVQVYPRPGRAKEVTEHQSLGGQPDVQLRNFYIPPLSGSVMMQNVDTGGLILLLLGGLAYTSEMLF